MVSEVGVQQPEHEPASFGFDQATIKFTPLERRKVALAYMGLRPDQWADIDSEKKKDALQAASRVLRMLRRAPEDFPHLTDQMS